MNVNPVFVLLSLALAFGRRFAGASSAPAPSAPPRPPPRPPGGSTTLPATVPASSHPSPGSTTVPWPQVVPAGLPAFPGPGWVPDIPVGPGVAARASQLLRQLWAGGEGTFKVEHTAGRWIAYRATRMGAKQGVVAYREIPGAAVPVRVPDSRDPGVGPAVPAAHVPVPGEPPPNPKNKFSLPTLRLGSKGPDVMMLQNKLGVGITGTFDDTTDRAVRNYQRSRGLTVDGVVGSQTWASLFASRAA